MLKDIRFYILGLLLAGLIAAGCSSSSPTVATVSSYSNNAFVSDSAGYNATMIDTALKNPWGIVNAPNSPLFVALNHEGAMGEYDATNGAPLQHFKIQDTVGTSVTGIVYNSDPTSFTIDGRGSSTYILASEDGILWGYSTTSLLLSKAVDLSRNSSFKGIALGALNNSPVLYAANFRNGSLDRFDHNFNRIGQFSDTVTGTSAIPANFAPFNAAVLNGTLYVSYAKEKGGGDDAAGLGNGYIDIFNADGTFQKRLVSNGNLNSPWGMAIAPGNFGDFKGKLLVGNFGDGRINVYDLANGSYLGQLHDATGNPLTIEGLWSLYVVNNTLYYTAGPDEEAHGVLGTISLR